MVKSVTLLILIIKIIKSEVGDSCPYSPFWCGEESFGSDLHDSFPWAKKYAS